MSATRRLALIAGVLYLVTFVTSIPTLFLKAPILNDPNFVLGAGGHGGVLWAGYLEVLLALACIGTAVVLYPVARRQSETAALGFLSARVLEAAVIFVGVFSLLAVVTLRQGLAGNAGADAAVLVAISSALVAVHDWTFLLGQGLIPAVNALCLGYVLYRSGLVPRIIPALGLIGAPILALSVTATLFGIYDQVSVLAAVAVVPIALWELSLGIWLVARGFDPKALARPFPSRTNGVTIGSGGTMIRPLATLTLALVLTLAATTTAQSDPLGTWLGAIGPGVIDLDIRVTIDADDDGLTGTIDIPVQGMIGYPLVNVVHDGDALSFAIPGVPGDPAFDGVIDGDLLEGTFSQGGQDLAFALERDHDAAALRPQEPVPPFPYDEEEVEFASGDVTLAGTLTLPEGDAPVPGLLLITGSGAQDRNEELLGHKPFLVLADHLTRAGYAVLRVDDRGVGGSTGSDARATFDDLLGDVLAGVELLREHPRVDADRVGLLGHSQGGYLAPSAALEADGAVAFTILMAGPAVDGFAVLVAQNERIIELAIRAADPNASESDIAAAVDDQIAFLEALFPLLEAEEYDGARALVRERIETELAAVPADARPDDAALEEMIRLNQEGVSPAFRAFLVFDPQPYLTDLTVPTLALFGELDVQVLPEQNEAPMRDALAGNPDATVITVPGLNHLMQPAITGGLEEYGAIDTTIDPVVLETITQWLQERFPSP